MTTTALVIYGPQGCGKSRNAAALAKYYGKSIIYDYDEKPSASKLRSMSAETLILTHEEVPGAVPFATAMRAAGLAR